MNIVISNLGEITPVNPAVVINVLSYTINIDPKHIMVDYNCAYWGDLSPDKQMTFLKKIHVSIYRDKKSYLQPENEVCFEFTKNGEVHSHGYFTFKDQYGGYDRYMIMFQKYVNSLIFTKSRFTCFVKWVDNLDKWKEYMHKDLATSGFQPYITTGEPQTNIRKIKSIIDFIEPESVPKIGTKENIRIGHGKKKA